MSLARSASSRLRYGAASSGKPILQVAYASTSSQYTSSSAYRSPPDRAPIEQLPWRIKPVPSSFYTTRPTYVDSLILLEDLAKRTKRALEHAHIPLEATATQKTSTISRAANTWLKSDELSKRLGVPLKSSQYRHVVARLKALSKYRRAVQEYFLDGQCGPANRTLALNIEETLGNFSPDAGGASRLENDDFYSKSSRVDALGRAYARGRRKESSARVWVVPKQLEAASEKDSLLSQSLLVNLQSLPEAFTRVAHRESVLYPLRLTGLMGVVNVFALVQGGGSSGQAGALAHGIARALVTFFDHQAKQAEASNEANASELRLKAISMRSLLGKDGVLNRDPRMVERKKTGLAKARKAYAWVKR